MKINIVSKKYVIHDLIHIDMTLVLNNNVITIIIKNLYISIIDRYIIE